MVLYAINILNQYIIRHGGLLRLPVFLHSVVKWVFTEFVFSSNISVTGYCCIGGLSECEGSCHQSDVMLKAQFLYPSSHA